MKKRNLIAVCIGISVISVLSLVGFVVSAYFTDNNTKDNTVTPGKILLKYQRTIPHRVNNLSGIIFIKRRLLFQMNLILRVI